MKFKDVFLNNFLYIKFIFSASKFRIFFDFVMTIWQALIQFLFDVYIFIVVLDGWQRGENFLSICNKVIVIGGVQLLYLVVKNLYEKCYIPQSDLKIISFLKNKIYNKSKEVDLCEFENPEYYDNYMKATHEISHRAFEIIKTLNSLVSNIIVLFTSSFVLFKIEPILILVILVPLAVNIFMGNKRKKIEYDYDMELEKINRKDNYIKRVFYLKKYAQEIRMTNIADALMKNFFGTTKSFYKTVKKFGFKIAFFEYIDYFLLDVFVELTACLIVAYRFLLTKSILIGSVIVVVNTISPTAATIMSVSDVLNEWREHATYIEKFIAFLNQKSKIIDEGILPLPKENQCIKLENVSFKYNNDARFELKNIDLEILPGQKVAIVGKNGAGKSTILKLILRLCEPHDGKITLNNHLISEYPLSEYRENFATVFQSFNIYAFSVLENVYLNDAITEKEINKAIRVFKLIGLENRINEENQGMDVQVTKEFDDNGLVLSGGENQKIAIARVLVNARPFLILDEPSSALDPDSEYKVYKALLNSYEGKAVLFITHRMSTAALADKVYFMENGCLVESGTHDELIKQNGKYAELWNKQTAYYKVVE